MFSRDFSCACSSSLFRLHTCYSWADSKAATPLIALFLHGLHKIYLTCIRSMKWNVKLWILKTVKQCNMQHWKHHLKFTSNVVTWHILVSDIDHLWQIGDISNNHWVYFINKSIFFGKCHNPLSYFVNEPHGAIACWLIYACLQTE